jgi:hypothetical protein
MGVNTASAQRSVAAPPDVVYRFLSDMRNHHPHFLPPAFSEFQVVAGGIARARWSRSSSPPADGAETSARL